MRWISRGFQAPLRRGKLSVRRGKLRGQVEDTHRSPHQLAGELRGQVEDTHRPPHRGQVEDTHRSPHQLAGPKTKTASGVGHELQRGGGKLGGKLRTPTDHELQRGCPGGGFAMSTRGIKERQDGKPPDLATLRGRHATAALVTEAKSRPSRGQVEDTHRPAPIGQQDSKTKTAPGIGQGRLSCKESE